MGSMVEPGLSSDRVGVPEVGLVPAELVPLLWDQVLPILQNKGERWLRMVSEEGVLRNLLTGNLDLWCGMQDGIVDGFMICGWERHDRASYYHVMFLAGEGLDKYLALGLEKIEQYASIFGGAEIVFDARKGFSRLLRKYGYYSNTVRMRKSVKVLWRN